MGNQNLKVGNQILHIKTGGVYTVTNIVKFKILRWWITTVWYTESGRTGQPTYVRLLSSVKRKFLFR